MALVNFHRLDAAAYAGIETKQPDTIYFVTDARRIYMGEKEYGLQVVSGTRPGTGSLNTLYIDPTAHTISYWNGTSYNALEIPFGTSISGSGDDAHLATTKAVVDYVTSQISNLDVSALAGRVTTLEGEMDTAQGQITTINGEGEGSIKKAASDAQTAAIAAAKSYTDQEAAKKANLKHTHEITDVTGLQDALDGKANATHTHTTAQVTGLDTALAGKADKATTLEGYGITDAYTKTQTDSKIAESIAAADHLKREIVESLPEVEEADENTIYMVPQGGSIEDPGTSTSHYNEYMLINGAFELVGSSQVDLSGYATETFVTNAIAALDKSDSAQEGQYVSAVSQENGIITVTRAQLPAAATLVEGTANGTVKFNGTDVPVHGLGSAAYTESTAYATAAQGTKADQVFAALTWQEG